MNNSNTEHRFLRRTISIICFTASIFLTVFGIVVIVDPSRGSARGFFDLGAALLCVIIFALTVLHEKLLNEKNSSLVTLAKNLEAEREKFLIVQNNLAVGVFLMDSNFIIQTQHSQSLAKLLGHESLSGRSFIDIVSPSLKPRQLSTLKDFFTLAFERTFSADTMRELNPIFEFEYINPSLAAKKTLRSFFSLAPDSSTGSAYILGALEDITDEAALRKELTKQQNHHDHEVQFVFEAFQCDPRIFKSFLAEVDYEISRYDNGYPPDAGASVRAKILTIYQTLHSIKSNAIILGLNEIGKICFTIESQVKECLEKTELTYEDALAMLDAFEVIRKHRLDHEIICNKICALSEIDHKAKHDDLILETARLAVVHTAKDLHKKVRLNILSIDNAALSSFHDRHLIRESIVQLVKNSIFHGIETPEVRVSGGLDETGAIDISITLEAGNLVIYFHDDGQGLDIKKITQKALQLNYFASENDLPKSDELIQLIFKPGFSTTNDTNAYAGRGIGLNTVHDRVTALGGSIKVVSEANKGATFIIKIPFATK